MGKDETYTHPSFGQIRFGRVNGHADFYGSELTQDHFITMEVRQSEVRRELSKDWYYAHGLPLIEIRMTSGQFAEMITSLNNGGGTCCTIEMVNRQAVPKMPPQESRKEFVHRKFEERMKEFSSQIKERRNSAKELVKKKTLSKEDVRNLSNHLDWLTMEVESNIPFFMKCFQETMDEVVYEAKTEVENAIQHKINTLGLNALHEENKLIENKNNKQ